ncbi:hypothetical protein Hanom_Chr01g00006011 [Helianthus anomalus]
MLGSSSTHPRRLVPNLAFIPSTMHLFTLSTCPLPWGCATDVKVCSMFISFIHFFRSSDAKLVPLSVTILSGRPNLHMMCSQMNLRTIIAVVDARALASTHFVK